MALKLANKLYNYAYDALLGISTSGIVPAERDNHIYYATVGYAYTIPVISRLGLTESDTFVDVGCGKGRVLCLAARHSIRQAIGVEYSGSLAATARRNADQLRGRVSPILVVCTAAENYDYSEATVLYFFNPFEAPLLDQVLGKIRTDRARRPLRLAFVMESEAQRRVFTNHSWLSCYDRYIDEEGRPVAFYQSQ